MKIFKKVRNQLFKIIHQGNKCYCIYCKHTYARFLHTGVKENVFVEHNVPGAGRRMNVKCPNCNSVDRSRLLYLFLQLRTEVLNKPMNVLHISPNPNLAHVLRSNNQAGYVCGALEPEKFKEFSAIKLDVTAIALDDNRFDIVICNHVLEHVKNDSVALSELFRVLKPGGFAILQVPVAVDLEKTIEDDSIVSAKDRKRLYGQTDHVRLYGLDYFDRIAKVGFEVRRDNPFTNRWIENIEKHCLNKHEDVILGIKPSPQ